MQKEKKFLKDNIAKKVLSSEECREYLLQIIALSLEMDMKEVKENIKLIDTNVSNHETLKDQETDLLLENDQNVFNIEINYNYYEEGMIKNRCYIANLLVRQIKKGRRYKEYKKIHQININNYDLYQKGEFIYRSYMMEEKYHLKRDEIIEIIDINLDFLSEVDYNEIKKIKEKDLRWYLYIFVCSSKEERKEIYQESTMMRKVYERMDKYTETLNELLYYNPEELKKEAEYNLGVKEGMEKGLKDGKIEIAKIMFKNKEDMEKIIKYTGLSQEEIENLNE